MKLFLERLLEEGTSPPSDGEGEEEITDEDNDLRNTLRIYGSIFLLLLLLASLCRKKFPRAYAIRSWVERYKTPLAYDSYGFLSWIWKLFSLSDSEMMEECGMDAICFIRVLEFGMKVAAVGVINAIWLVIVYRTEPDGGDQKSVLAGLSTAKLPTGSNRFIATVIACYVIFGFCMYTIIQEFKWFIKFRHTFLSRHMPRNYTVYVQNIPLAYRSNQKLFEFFSNAYENSVLDARLAVDCPNLKKMVEEREKVVANLEHAINIKEVKGIEPRKKNPLTRADEGSLIVSLQTELMELNKNISESIDAITSIDTNEMITAGANRDAEEVEENTPEHVQEGAGTKRNSNAKKVIGGLTNVAGAATNVAQSLFAKEDGEVLSAGFVSFKTLRATHAALQMVQYSEPFTMEVLEAPQSEDTFWPNVGKTHKELQVSKLIVTVLTVVLCLLWTIPMSFISSLSSIEGLREKVKFIDEILTSSPWLVPVVAQLAPLLIVVAKVILRMLLEFLSLREGLISGAVVQASFFTKFAWFIILQTFFVSAISGSIIEELSEMLQEPQKIVDKLAETLPEQSTKFIQFLLVDSSITLGIELLRVSPVATAIIRSKLGPNLTEKESNTTWMGLRPLADPEGFRHGYVLANSILYFMVFFVYSTIAPITTVFVGICFFFMAAVYRHQFVYVYPTFPDSGGKLWANFFALIPFCMIIAQITIVGMIALKQSFVAVILMIPLIVFTLLFNIYIKQQHFMYTNFLPAREAIVTDQNNMNEAGDNFESLLRDKYIQPELREKEQLPENYAHRFAGNQYDNDEEMVEAC